MHKAVHIDFAKFHQPTDSERELHRAVYAVKLSEILFCVYGSYARA